jgi:multidrug efflux system membrane fusion protein
VRVRVVAEPTARASLRYSASVEAATRVDLAFRVSGYISQVAVVNNDGQSRKIQEGDHVTKGTVLAMVRPSDYEQRVSAARASLAQAVASAKQAQLDFDRSSKLYSGNSVSKADLDNHSARADLARAQVDGAKAQLAGAEISLADCALRAPMDGVVLKRSVELGSLVSAGFTACVLADTRTVKVVFGAPDSLLGKLKLGSSLAVTFDALHGAFSGVITRIAPSADVKSRAFDVEATIPNPNDDLKVENPESLTLPEAAESDASLALPLTAVVRSPHDVRGFAVFVVDGPPDRYVARQRDVALGSVLGNTVLVSSGLQAGERVVAMGATLLVDGDPIRIIP